jgi:hypothetical protein
MDTIFNHTKKLIILISFTIVISSCIMSARLYRNDGRVVTAKFSYGRVWGTFPDGETFQGEHYNIENQGISKALFITPWGPLDEVSESQAGPKVYHIKAAGDNGTRIQCIIFPQGAHGFGSCRDSKGRGYRLQY